MLFLWIIYHHLDIAPLRLSLRGYVRKRTKQAQKLEKYESWEKGATWLSGEKCGGYESTETKFFWYCDDSVSGKKRMTIKKLKIKAIIVAFKIF